MVLSRLRAFEERSDDQTLPSADSFATRLESNETRLKKYGAIVRDLVPRVAALEQAIDFDSHMAPSKTQCLPWLLDCKRKPRDHQFVNRESLFFLVNQIFVWSQSRGV